MDDETAVLAVPANHAPVETLDQDGPEIQSPTPPNGNGQHLAPHAIPDAAPDADSAPGEPMRIVLDDESAESIQPEQIVEALLFASDAPLSAARLAEMVGSGTAGDVKSHIDTLNRRYRYAGMSFQIEKIAGGYRMMTLAAFRPWLKKLIKHRSNMRLTDAALETLAIVAYKQPVIRADVEAIRGVACGEVLNRIREIGLIRIAGRAEVVGRPILYGTTRKFLDIFGMAGLDELPPMEALVLKRPATAEAPEEAEQPASEPRTAAEG